MSAGLRGRESEIRSEEESENRRLVESCEGMRREKGVGRLDGWMEVGDEWEEWRRGKSEDRLMIKFWRKKRDELKGMEIVWKVGGWRIFKKEETMGFDCVEDRERYK